MYHSFKYLIVFLFVVSCSGNTSDGTSSDLVQESETLLKYFDSDVASAINEVKTTFDQELSKGFGDRPLSYIYEQHALRMKLDLLNNEPFEHVIPYNGKYRLNAYPEQVQKIPFLTDKCGFQTGESGKIVNYLCINLDDRFFEYLTNASNGNTLIDQFVESYREAKSITPDFKRSMLMGADETLDFNNLDQQVFYFLFHATVNEEYWASKAIGKE